MVAFSFLDRCFVLPAATTQFASHGFGALGSSGSQFLGQLKVALHAFDITAIEAEDRLSMAECHIIGQLPIFGDAAGCEIADVDCQGFQLAVFLG